MTKQYDRHDMEVANAMMVYEDLMDAGELVLNFLRLHHADPAVMAYLDVALDSVVNPAPCPPTRLHDELTYLQAQARYHAEEERRLRVVKLVQEATWPGRLVQDIFSTFSQRGRLRRVQRQAVDYWHDSKHQHGCAAAL